MKWEEKNNNRETQKHGSKMRTFGYKESENILYRSMMILSGTPKLVKEAWTGHEKFVTSALKKLPTRWYSHKLAAILWTQCRKQQQQVFCYDEDEPNDSAVTTRNEWKGEEKETVHVCSIKIQVLEYCLSFAILSSALQFFFFLPPVGEQGTDRAKILRQIYLETWCCIWWWCLSKSHDDYWTSIIYRCLQNQRGLGFVREVEANWFLQLAPSVICFLA